MQKSKNETQKRIYSIIENHKANRKLKNKKGVKRFVYSLKIISRQVHRSFDQFSFHKKAQSSFEIQSRQIHRSFDQFTFYEKAVCSIYSPEKNYQKSM